MLATEPRVRAPAPVPRRAPPREPLDSEPRQVGDLLGALYEGALEQPPWDSALRLLQLRLQAAHVSLILRPPTADSAGVMINVGGNPAAQVSYEKQYFAMDPFVSLKEGEVMTPEELIGKQWLEGPMYQDYLRPQDVRYVLGADVYTPEGIECRLRATRGHGSLPFGEQDKALFRYILPHLKRSIQIQSKLDSLECERQMLAGTVNRMLLGVISLSQTGEILEINDEARRILAERDGLWRGPNGLQADNADDRRELQRLIQRGLGHGSGAVAGGMVEAMPVSRPSGRARLSLVVKAVPGADWCDARRRPAAVIFLRDPDCNTAPPSLDLVRRLLGLTRVESRMALLLAEGSTLDEAAELMNIRRNTARTHLRSIFCKTGVTRQTMLVRLLLRSVFSLG
ncbi:helix-turn-helix transcriptional regulator [Solimonas sp. K1W22B-7]|uniref:helix-turn-helix transcriptional regulator n=1 Tax=Solimonas sp. K1W22B-7 TaxID=2303331 RepID=UPI000E337156|nr:helix-turn-helix transcriptional regulator [Solimonas sp. K1W22B-7]AXQ28753.1 helix-turn-helix transcriptional regulator [Solimonas sp. K1W22B-7]